MKAACAPSVYWSYRKSTRKVCKVSFALVGVVTNKPPCIRLDILVTVLKVVGDNTNNGG
jgi:hypothetical protein